MNVVKCFVTNPEFSSSNERHNTILKTLSEASEELKQTFSKLDNIKPEGEHLKGYKIVSNEKIQWKGIQVKDINVFWMSLLKNHLSRHKKWEDCLKTFEEEIFDFQITKNPFGEGCSKITYQDRGRFEEEYKEEGGHSYQYFSVKEFKVSGVGENIWHHYKTVQEMQEIANKL